jgi:HEPN domain
LTRRGFRRPARVAFDRVTKAPLDAQEHERWRAEADSALLGARVQAEADLRNWACFAAEQAAHLALKGLLHGLGRAPWGDDLVRLGAMLAEAGIEPPAPGQRRHAAARPPLHSVALSRRASAGTAGRALRCRARP